MADRPLAFSASNVASDKGKLIYKASGGDVNKLCYKGYPEAGHITISIGWAGDRKDLDICAWWGAVDRKVGYNNGGSYHNVTGNDGRSYNIEWSGDMQGEGGTETLEIWFDGTGSTLNASEFYVTFNFFGRQNQEDEETTWGPAICNVIVSQNYGATIIKQGIMCGDRTLSAASPSDPGIQVTVVYTGILGTVNTYNY